MSLVVEDVMTYLAEHALGQPGIDLFSYMPDDTDVGGVLVTAVIETPGMPPAEALSGEVYERPRFQVNVRGGDYPTARHHAQAVYDALSVVVNLTLGESYYLSITPTQNPFPAGGPDDQGRRSVVCTYQVERVRAPSS